MDYKFCWAKFYLLIFFLNLFLTPINLLQQQFILLHILFKHFRLLQYFFIFKPHQFFQFAYCFHWFFVHFLQFFKILLIHAVILCHGSNRFLCSQQPFNLCQQHLIFLFNVCKIIQKGFLSYTVYQSEESFNLFFAVFLWKLIMKSVEGICTSLLLYSRRTFWLISRLQVVIWVRSVSGEICKLLIICFVSLKTC